MTKRDAPTSRARCSSYLAALILLIALIVTPMGIAGCAVSDDAPAAQVSQDKKSQDDADEAAAKAAFAKLDINEDGYLSGSELAACRCLAYDISGGTDGGDGVVSELEFVTLNILERRGIEASFLQKAAGTGSTTAASATTSQKAAAAREPRPAASTASTGQTVTEAPLTRAEVLALLRSMPGSQDHSVPYETRREASRKQVRLIETRGIDFRYDMGKFDRELYEAGISTDVMVAMSRNYRAPGSTPRMIEAPVALVGRYDMGIAGSTTRYDRSGSSVVRTDRDVGFAGGGLVIGADGRYEWRLLSNPTPSMTFRGAWRPATEAEAGSYVGPAIILTRAYEGADWIVTRRESSVPGEHIKVVRVDQRYRSYLGSRQKR